MDYIIRVFNDLDMDYMALLRAGGLLLAGSLLLGLFGRFIFGKKSALNCAVSSAIGILFLYVLSIILKRLDLPYTDLIPPLPFVTIEGENLVLFSFKGAGYFAICGEILNMIILSFLVNLVDQWMPKGKKILGWILFRVLTVLIAAVLHLATTGLLSLYLPEGIITYAPPVLLGLLLVLLLTGALKVPVGALLTTVNPVIAALYTFFFANMIGKQITKAILTAGICAGLVILLQELGFGVLSLSPAILVTYLPYAALLVVLWYVIGHLL